MACVLYPPWLRPALLAALLGVSPLGCTDWRVQPVEPLQLIQERHPAEVRLGRRAARRVDLRQPWVHHGTIWGLRGSDTVRVVPGDVTTIAVRRTDWVETAVLLATPPALLFGFACLVACGY